MVDWNSLAEVAPILAAGFTGNPETFQNTMQGYGAGQKIKKDQALRSFGRELFALGHPATEQEVQQIATKHGLDPLTAQALVSTFMDQRRQKRMLELKEGQETREQEEWDIKKKTPILSPYQKKGQELLAEQDFGYKPPVNVGEGQKLVDPSTGKVIAEGGRKSPSSAMAAFLQQNPDATWDQIAEASRSLKVPDQTTVNVDVGEKGMTKLAEKMSETLVTDFSEASKANLSYQNLQETKKMLDDPIITGAGAEAILAIGKGLQRLGVSTFDEPIKNTEAYQAAMGRQVGEIIKQFGAGTGLSDADREYAEKAAGGKVQLSIQSLRKIIEINEKAYKNIISNYNTRASQAMGRPGAESLPYDLRIKMPGQDQAQGQGQPQSQGGGLTLDINAIQEELRRRKGGQ